MNRKNASPRRVCLSLASLFFALAFLQLSIRDGDDRLAILAGAVPVALILGSLIPVRMFSLDRLITSTTLMLCAFGILATASADPASAVSHALGCAVAVTFLLPGSLLFQRIHPSVGSAVVCSVMGLGLLSVPLLMPYLHFSCPEAALVLLTVAFVSLLMSRNQLSAMLPALAGTALLLAGGSPVTAVIWSVVFLALMWACAARSAVLILTLASAGLLFYGFWIMVPDCFALKTSEPPFPFSPGLWGPEEISTVPDHFSAALPHLACRYGLLLAGSIVLMYPLIMLRGVSLARSARARFSGLLGMGVCMLLSLLALGSMLYDLDILRVQSLSMPFLADDFPSLCACFLIIGMLGGLSSTNRQDLEEEARLSTLSP